MMKICIIDDEREVRISIMQKLVYLFPHEKIFDVGFGQQALEQVQTVQPDLVFLDIRMPEISGLDILHELKQAYPQMHVVIISGYDDFEYARKSLQYGALDYLLKPVDRGELKEMVEKVKHHMNERFLQEFGLLAAKRPSNGISVKDLSLQPYNTSLWFDERQWKKLLIGKQASLLKGYETRSDEILCTFRLEPNLEGIVALSDKVDSSGIFRAKEDFFHTLETEWRNQKLLQFFQPKDHDVFLDGLKIQHNQRELRKNVVQTRQRILNACRSGDVDKLNSHLHEWSAWIEQLSFDDLQKECGILMAMLDEGLSRNEMIVIEENTLQYWMDWVARHRTWDELKQRIHGMVVNGIRALKILEEEQDKGDVDHWFEQALHLIDSTDDLNMTLDSIADLVHVHPVTLSRMFKQRTGINFVRYLTRKRLEHARQQLLNSNKKINEISEEVGYTDYAYFRSLFKKEYGMSPSQYRVEHGILLID